MPHVTQYDLKAGNYGNKMRLLFQMFMFLLAYSRLELEHTLQPQSLSFLATMSSLKFVHVVESFTIKPDKLQEVWRHFSSITTAFHSLTDGLLVF